MKRFLCIVIFALATLSFGQTRSPFSYNADIVDYGNGKKIYEFHAGHINFRNLEGRFRRISTELTWRPLLQSWTQDSSNYACRIPLYADGWFVFTSQYKGSDYVLRAQPTASHVKGVLTKDANSGQSVYYKDAFGVGIDFQVWPARDGLRKVIIIREKPAKLADMSFSFRLVIPVEERLAAIRSHDGSLWDGSRLLDFTDRDVRLGEAGKEIYFNNARMWDSAGREEPVKIEMYRELLSLYLRKTVPASFLESAAYPIYTDHPTNYAPTAGDGFCGLTSKYTSWYSIRSGSSSSTTNYTTTYSYATEFENDPSVERFSICRGFFPIDTAEIPDGAAITAASFFFYASSKTVYGGDYDYINIVQTTQADSTKLVSSDYAKCGPLNGATKLSADKSVSSILTSGYTEMALNSSGIAAINKTGTTRLGMRSGYDLENEEPPSSSYGKVQAYFSEYTGTDRDPYLSVTVEESSYGGYMMFISE